MTQTVTPKDAVRLLGYEEFNKERQEEEKERKPVTLKVVGGKEPPEDGNYFTDMEIGTIFLVRSKQNLSDYNLGLFRLEQKTPKSAILRTPSIPQSLYIIPINFCKIWSLYEVQGIIEDKDIEEAIAIAKDTEKDT